MLTAQQAADLIKAASQYDSLIVAELDLAKAKPEGAPSLKPPKGWWDKMVAQVKKSNPEYNDEQIKATVGSIWYEKMSGKGRSKKRKAEGKKYGPAPVAKAFDTALAGIESLAKGDMPIIEKDELLQKGVADTPHETDEKAKLHDDLLKAVLKGVELFKSIFKTNLQKAVVKEPGKRGGQIVGRTKTGQPIYASKKKVVPQKAPAFKGDWNKNEHLHKFMKEHKGKHHEIGGEKYKIGSKVYHKGDKSVGDPGREGHFVANTGKGSVLAHDPGEKEFFEIDHDKLKKSMEENKVQSTDDLIKAIITEVREEISSAPDMPRPVVDETGKKLKPTEIRAEKVLQRFEDGMKYYREDLERNFSFAKLSIKDWMKNRYFSMYNCTNAEKEKVAGMLEKAKPKICASVARTLIWKLEDAVRTGAINNNDPKMNQFKNQLMAYINKTKKKIKKSYSDFDDALENLNKAIKTDEDLSKAKTCPDGKSKKDKKEKEEKENETKYTEKSFKSVYDILSKKYPVGGVFYIPKEGAGTIVKSLNGCLTVNIMGIEHEVDLAKSINPNENMFTNLFKSASLQTGEDLLKGGDSTDVIKATENAEKLANNRDSGYSS